MAKSKRSSKAKAKPKAKARPKAKAKAKARPKAKAKAKAKPKAKAKAKAKPKTKAKAKPATKPTPKAKPAAKPSTNTVATPGPIVDALQKLHAWAAAGGTLLGAPPDDDAARRLQAPQPEWGTIAWQLPPSYRDFLAHHSRLLIKWGPNTGHEEFVVLDPDEIAETGGIVYMPADVSRDPDKYLSTNHLVPFASGGNDECAFCFDVTAPDASGEYPVYYHHQDEPRARYKDGGAWEDPQNATPDFASFAAWLTWVADELAGGGEPESSYPSAFYNMPGRKRAG